MAFPVIADTNSLANNSVSTNHTINLPPNISNGDLLLIFFVTDGDNTIDYWTEGFIGIFSMSDTKDIHLSIAYKIATGTEGATTGVVTTSAEKSVSVTYRITGHDSATAPEVSTGVSETTNMPNPDTLTPTGGAKDYLWIAVEGNDDDDANTGYPANYTLSQIDLVVPDAGGANISVAGRNLNASSEDPPAFAIAASEQCISCTVAVHPTSGAIEYLDGIVAGQSALSAQYVELSIRLAPTKIIGLSDTPYDNLGVKYSIEHDISMWTAISTVGDTELKRAFDIIGSLAAQSGADASLGLFKLLAGAIAGTSNTPDAALKLLMEILGTSDGQSGTLVDLAVAYSILGEVTGQSATTVSLDVLRELIGSIAGQSNVPDTTLGIFKLIEGALAGQSNVLDSDITLTMKMVGDVDAISNLPALEIKINRKLAGLSEAESTVTGRAGLLLPLAGDIDALTTLTGDLEVQAVIPLSGLVSGLSNIPDTDIKLAMKIVGTINSQAGVDGEIKLTMELIGDTGGLSSTDATLKAIRWLEGDVDAQSTLAGTLQSIAYLLGTVTGASSVDGGLRVTYELVGVIDGQSVILGTLTQITPYAIEITQIYSTMSDLLTKITTERTDLITEIWTEM